MASEAHEPTRCGLCWHYPRCSWLISAEFDRDHCDWEPSRYIPAHENLVERLERERDEAVKLLRGIQNISMRDLFFSGKLHNVARWLDDYDAKEKGDETK